MEDVAVDCITLIPVEVYQQVATLIYTVVQALIA